MMIMVSELKSICCDDGLDAGSSYNFFIVKIPNSFMRYDRHFIPSREFPSNTIF